VRLGLFTTFRASRKEPLSEVLDRVHSAFLQSGGPPELIFALADAPIPGFVSSVDRVLKRYPDFHPFLREEATLPGGPAIRHLTNRSTGQAITFDLVKGVASGMPRSFPFHSAVFWLARSDFGPPPQSPANAVIPGVSISDSWWVNGRMRSVSATMIVEADTANPKLASLPPSVEEVLDACGKASKRTQIPLADQPAGPFALAPLRRPEVAAPVAAVVTDYRARFEEILLRANLPHDLPPADYAMRVSVEATGPRKPVLVDVFRPMGYDCQGGSGTFELRRRTEGNLTVEVSLDVGTWSRSLTGSFQVHGLGFTATLPLRVSRRATPASYPIGDAAQWRQMVENLGALVAELDRSFVPAVEAASGPSPAWYHPER
jgi:hypothetical protein